VTRHPAASTHRSTGRSPSGNGTAHTDHDIYPVSTPASAQAWDHHKGQAPPNTRTCREACRDRASGSRVPPWDTNRAAKAEAGHRRRSRRPRIRPDTSHDAWSSRNGDQHGTRRSGRLCSQDRRGRRLRRSWSMWRRHETSVEVRRPVRVTE
jgi:hypothetical protein